MEQFHIRWIGFSPHRDSEERGKNRRRERKERISRRREERIDKTTVSQDGTTQSNPREEEGSWAILQDFIEWGSGCILGEDEQDWRGRTAECSNWRIDNTLNTVHVTNYSHCHHPPERKPLLIHLIMLNSTSNLDSYANHNTLTPTQACVLYIGAPHLQLLYIYPTHWYPSTQTYCL